MSKTIKTVSKLLEGVRLMRMKQIAAYTSLSKPYLYNLINYLDSNVKKGLHRCRPF